MHFKASVLIVIFITTMTAVTIAVLHTGSASP